MIDFSISASDRLSASRTTGTTSPFSVEMATPMCCRWYCTMSVPSMAALTLGTPLSARTTAFTNSDMKPSFTPCVSTNSFWHFLRRSMIWLMSASLNVVSIAASCWALTSRLAMVRRIMLMRLRVTSPTSARAATGATGLGALPTLSLLAMCDFGAVVCAFSAAASTSSLRMRPPLPEPVTEPKSIPSSSACTLADGVVRTSVAWPSGLSSAGAGGSTGAGVSAWPSAGSLPVAAGSSLFAGASPASSMDASTPPIGSSSPMLAWVVITPATSVGISCEALSVSISQMMSPALQ